MMQKELKGHRNRGHKLLTKAIANKIPKMYETDGQGDSVKVHLKLFSPYNGWTWYITELDPDTHQAFGLTVGLEAELGYIDLNELDQAAKMNGALPLVERDCHWKTQTLGECRRLHNKR